MPVFETATHEARIADRSELAAVQRFFEANPSYIRLIERRAVAPNAAEIEFDDMPPPELAFAQKWWLLVRSRSDGEIVALIDVLEDFTAPGIWHISLFFVAEALHGSGLAATLHAELQAWAVRGGARWLRLGVVSSNPRAVRFWRRRGYGFVCARQAPAEAGHVNTVWCLAKPLGDDTLAGYIAAQTRDAVEAEPAGWQALGETITAG